METIMVSKLDHVQPPAPLSCYIYRSVELLSRHYIHYKQFGAEDNYD